MEKFTFKQAESDKNLYSEETIKRHKDEVQKYSEMLTTGLRKMFDNVSFRLALSTELLPNEKIGKTAHRVNIAFQTPFIERSSEQLVAIENTVKAFFYDWNVSDIQVDCLGAVAFDIELKNDGAYHIRYRRIRFDVTNNNYQFEAITSD